MAIILPNFKFMAFEANYVKLHVTEARLWRFGVTASVGHLLRDI